MCLKGMAADATAYRARAGGLSSLPAIGKSGRTKALLVGPGAMDILKEEGAMEKGGSGFIGKVLPLGDGDDSGSKGFWH